MAFKGGVNLGGDGIVGMESPKSPKNMQVIVIMRLEKYQLRTYLIGESSPNKVQPHQNKEKKQKNTFLKETILKKIHNAGFRSETALGNAGFRPGLKLL